MGNRNRKGFRKGGKLERPKQPEQPKLPEPAQLHGLALPVWPSQPNSGPIHAAVPLLPLSPGDQPVGPVGHPYHPLTLFPSSAFPAVNR